MTSTAVPSSVSEDLEPAHADLITATLPLVGANIDAITRSFYQRLFEAHPSLLRNLFNRGNQAQGAQQRALAASIATFATHLVNPDLPHPAELLSRIGHKHASLGITADQYPIVHQHLFAAIVEVLGADTVTAEVAEAWDRVYWIMADTLIDMERALYEEAGVAAGDVYRRARVTGRVDDPSGAVLVTVGGPAATFEPGQYVSVGVTLPDGARQLRQYSLVNASGGGELTFAVKPAGEVSGWIRDNLRVGDVIDITVPFGDLPAPQPGAPLVLISAGIGVTPMLGILEAVLDRAPGTAVQVLHADRSEAAHPLRERQRELVERLPNATLQLWYEDLLSLDGVELPADAEVYLCGNDGFVRAVRDQLVSRGVTRVHCELFSPNDWLLS
ncbi:globin domain-containing protein [Mycolicibacterium sp. P9-22]|uniref:globin domain-containing protein n=1 Tax=Mycolicibacterium sp. P9-22 TaxID=2024613 RepID=UPI0011ECE882|nr:globin domain-containing protein [Mycolicibacterium sp. P9-22]KAA0118520.1 hemin transporter [Mycolicibacterium sp. P9-22]